VAQQRGAIAAATADGEFEGSTDARCSFFMVRLRAAHRRLGQDSYGPRNFLGTVMRHFFAVRALPRRVIARPLGRALVAPARRAHRTTPRGQATRAPAVAIAAIAAPAQEEDLPALGAMADDKPERVHVPGEADHQELDRGIGACDEQLSHPRPVDDMRARSGDSGLSLFVGSSLWDYTGSRAGASFTPPRSAWSDSRAF
jgi:hypothetical protein